MAQNMFTYGEKQEEFTEEDAKKEFSKIKEKLREEAESIPVPDVLDAHRMLELLENEIPGETKPPRVVNYKKEYLRFAAYAACFVLVISGFARMVANRAAQESGGASLLQASESSFAAAAEEKDDAAENKAAAPKESAVSAFSNGAQTYDDVYWALLEIRASDEARLNSSVKYAATADGASSPTAQQEEQAGDALLSNGTFDAESAEPEENPVTAGGGSYYTGTNTQIAGVDEADIIKTDGEYLYHYRYDNAGGGEIRILRAKDLSVCSAVTLPSYLNGELYLSGDTLILAADTERTETPVSGKMLSYLSASADEAQQDEDWIVPDYYSEYTSAQTTTLFVYDVSDRTAPKRETVFEQAGSYVSSRMADGVLYLVSNQYVDSYGVSPQSDAAAVLPTVMRDGEGSLLAASDIMLPVLPQYNAGYCIVTAFDIESRETATKAVLGGTETIMMSGDTLILSDTLYDGGWRDRFTGVTRFSVGGKDGLRYVSSGKVPGWTDGQFAYDVSDTLLRVATTSYGENGDTENNLYIYDEAMKLVGSVEGLAEGERIYSVRYFGDTAYVVTFRETDPLFVIDLSDPKNPSVEGQLKIPGFSEYLHPVGDGLLIGLGQNTAQTSYGGVVTDGIKLSLFDVSDPKHPTELSAYVIGNSGSWSEALENHKAFLYDAKNSRIGFPATICKTYGATASNPWGTSSSTVFSGYLVFSFDRNGFIRVGSVENESSADPLAHSDYGRTIERGVVIGDTLYTVASGRIGAYSYRDFSLLKEQVY